MSQSHLAISLLLKGRTLTATLTASSVDILASFAKSLLAQLVPNDPALQKNCSFLASYFLVVKGGKVSRCIGRPRVGQCHQVLLANPNTASRPN